MSADHAYVPEIEHASACSLTRAPWHWGHPRPLPNVESAGVHVHGMPVYPTYPNELQEPNHWMYKLCQEPNDDLSTCCEGFWFPYSLYGKINYRLDQMNTKKDPLDEVDYKCCNPSCISLFFLDWICLQFPLIMITQARIRAMFSIEGSVGQDFVTAFFCGRCALMMMDREIRAREKYCCVLHNTEARTSLAVSRQPSLHPGMIAVPQDDRRENRKDKMAQKKADCPAAFVELQELRPAKLRKARKGAFAETIDRHSESDFNGSQLRREESVRMPVQPFSKSKRIQRPSEKSTKKFDRSNVMQPWRSRPDKTNEKVERNSESSQDGLIFEGHAGPSGHLIQHETAPEFHAKLHKQEISQEEVVVYYGSGVQDRPQRHRLADCARTRQSTPGMANIPCYDHILSNEEVVNVVKAMSEEQCSFNNCPDPIETSNTNNFVSPCKLQQHLGECNDDDNPYQKIESRLKQHILDDCDEEILRNKGKGVLYGNIEYVLARRQGHRDSVNNLNGDLLLQPQVQDDPVGDNDEAVVKEQHMVDQYDLDSCLSKFTVRENCCNEQQQPDQCCSKTSAVQLLPPVEVHHLAECGQIVPTMPTTELDKTKPYSFDEHCANTKSQTYQAQSDSMGQRSLHSCNEKEVTRIEALSGSTEKGMHTLNECDDQAGNRIQTPGKSMKVKKQLSRRHSGHGMVIAADASSRKPSSRRRSSAPPTQHTSQFERPKVETHAFEECEIITKAQFSETHSEPELHTLGECGVDAFAQVRSSIRSSATTQSARRHSSYGLVATAAKRNLASRPVILRAVTDVTASKVAAERLHCLSNYDPTEGTVHHAQDRPTTLLEYSYRNIIPLIQVDVAECDSTKGSLDENKNSSYPVTSEQNQDGQNFTGKCVSTECEDSEAKEEAKLPRHSNAPSECSQHGLGECEPLKEPTRPNSLATQHYMADCSPIEISIEAMTIPISSSHHDLEDCDTANDQSDNAPDKVLPPSSATSSTLNSFAPTISGLRTPSGAESVLRHLLGTLGGEPLDGSCDLPDRLTVALDIGVTGPAPTVGAHGISKARNRNRNLNQKTKSRASNRTKGGKSSSGAGRKSDR